MDVRERTESITTTVSAHLAGTGVVVDDVTVQQAGKRRLVRVFLARDLVDLAPDDATSTVEPLSLDEIADATRGVSAALDESDVMGEAPYTLEVSSAGLDRPLTTRDQFRRNVGRLVAVTVAEGEKVTGRLTRVDEHGIHLEEAEAPLAWDHVVKAAVQVEFTRRSDREHDREDD